jgi:hypothetical protein
MAAAKKKKPKAKATKSKKPAKAAKTAKKPAKKPAKAKKPAAAKPKKPPKPTGLLPTAEEEARFWSLIEDAWGTQSAEINAARLALATRTPSEDDEAGDLEEAADGVLDSLRAAFENEDFPKEELVAMDRVLERKLYDIDRADVQAVTDGSDDGFLYARGFIVALGKAFYEAVRANPEMAICDAELEQMCYLPADVYSDRFGGELPDTGSGISRESCHNREGWRDA